ncbi:MAG TPA: threonine--tRNA ligase [Candidatus Paceibacterota bacterium]
MKIPNPIKLLRRNKPQIDIEAVRHTMAHILATSVLELFPGSENSIGPAIDNGFYQDFEIVGNLSDKDLGRIEGRMREKIKEWVGFEKREIVVDEVIKLFPHNKYKRELASDFAKEGKDLTLHNSLNAKGEVVFLDLCKGGHVENPSKDINPDAFRLTHVAGAYWRGDEKNKMLTRIYGLAFNTREELDTHIKILEEAKKRDHRKLGSELGLFVFSDTVGKGLPLWTEKGATVRRILERFIVDEEIRRGYTHVITPDIASLELYKKSGHYPYFKDSMYSPITIDDEQYMLRPMTCPHHFELYLNSGTHSYRELPMRIAEVAKLYRYEQSGELTGLIRLRSFSLADAHIICADPNQAKDEVKKALDLIEFCADKFGFTMGKEYRYRLSLGDRGNKEKYYDSPENWTTAEDKLREVLKERKCEYYEAENEAAFYGPKIDVQMRNVMGKEDTAFTVQYDFCMPGRFNLTYVNQKGENQEAVVIHRSSIGCVERVMAFLIEHTAGNFPFWLAPVQVKVLPITDTQHKYSKEVFDKLITAGIRAEIDLRTESLGKKIHDAKIEKIPYLLVIGEKEMKNGTVTLESRELEAGGKKGETMSVANLLTKLSKENLV